MVNSESGLVGRRGRYGLGAVGGQRWRLGLRQGRDAHATGGGVLGGGQGVGGGWGGLEPVEGDAWVERAEELGGGGGESGGGGGS